jgi:uncharacterized membrane protein
MDYIRHPTGTFCPACTRKEMKRKRLIFIIAILLAGILTPWISTQAARAQAPLPVVRAVLFYSPACGHCHYIITEVLPAIFDHYGRKLEMIGIDVTQPDGQTVFFAALEKYKVEYAAVPFLVVGDVYLMGDVDIPQQFPGLIEHYLAQGGVDWPEIAGLAEVIAGTQSTLEAQASPSPLLPSPYPTVPTPVEGAPISDPEPIATSESLVLTGEVEASLGDRLAKDPAGNGLAVVVLVGMMISAGWSGRYIHRAPGRRMKGAVSWIIPALCIAGLGVAGYLSYVETAQVQAICGPVGDCNTVQQSEYARLFGILPIGVLGMAGYVMILLAWGAMLFIKGGLAHYAPLALLGMTVFGTIFSIYLTFLEPFVIGATCAWCLTSAIIMTILTLLSLAPGKLAIRKLTRWNRWSRTGYLKR